MVVANEPWQKVDSRHISTAGDRLAMVETAVEPLEGIVASDLEMRRGGPSYSVDTLEELALQEPDAELFLILGADAAVGLDSWERADELDELCTIVVVDRPGTTGVTPHRFRVRRVEVPRLEVSSTDLRERVRDGRPTRYLLPDAVRDMIVARRLYSGTP